MSWLGFGFALRSERPPAGAAAWTPAQLATLPLVWLDAKDAATITQSSGNVSAWANKGSAGGSAVQATGGLQPGYSATANNGLPGLTFTGASSQFLDLSALAGSLPNGTAASCLAALAFINAATSVNTGIISLYPGSTNSGTIRVVGANNAGGNAWFSNSVVNDFSPGSSVLGTTVGIVGSQGAGATPTSIDMSINGTDFTNAPAGGVATSNTSVHIGRLNTWYLTGVVQEALILGYVPSLSERQKLEGYLMWRWGQQASLPGGHPYKSAAP